MFADTQPNGELANACVTASCLAHGKKVWTGGDAHEWRHQDNKPCAGQRVEHTKTCRCWDCVGDPFAGIPQADESPLVGDCSSECPDYPGLRCVVNHAAAAPESPANEHYALGNRWTSDPFAGGAFDGARDLAADALAAVNRRELERGLFFRPDGTRRPVTLRGVQADLFDVATTELVAPGMNGVLF